MQYKGKLYGKVGKKYFDLDKTADDFDDMEKELAYLKQVLHGIYNLCDEDNESHVLIQDLADKALH